MPAQLTRSQWEQLGYLGQGRVKGPIRHRTVDQDDGWAITGFVEGNFGAVI